MGEVGSNQKGTVIKGQKYESSGRGKCKKEERTVIKIKEGKIREEEQ